MRIKYLLTIVCLTFFSMVQAQKKEVNFQSLVQVGLLEGEQGAALQLQTINGIQYKTWSAGIGVGLDYYHTRTIPLFLDVRKAFSGKEKSAFIYASGGYNFSWLSRNDKEWFVTDGKGGLYYDAGIGYQLPVMKNSSLFFSVGYSVKKISTTNMDGIIIAIFPAPPPTYYQYNYTLQRISIKTGLRF